jgi:hypothetical protein
MQREKATAFEPTGPLACDGLLPHAVSDRTRMAMAATA